MTFDLTTGMPDGSPQGRKPEAENLLLFFTFWSKKNLFEDAIKFYHKSMFKLRGILVLIILQWTLRRVYCERTQLKMIHFLHIFLYKWRESLEQHIVCWKGKPRHILHNSKNVEWASQSISLRGFDVCKMLYSPAWLQIMIN